MCLKEDAREEREKEEESLKRFELLSSYGCIFMLIQYIMCWIYSFLFFDCLTGPDEGHCLTEAITNKAEKSMWEHFLKVKLTANISNRLLAVLCSNVENAALEQKITFLHTES